MHYNQNVFRASKEYFTKNNVKFVTLEHSANASEKCIDFNKSMSVQYILLDMNVEDLNISLDSVDLGMSNNRKLKFFESDDNLNSDIYGIAF